MCVGDVHLPLPGPGISCEDDEVPLAVSDRIGGSGGECAAYPRRHAARTVGSAPLERIAACLRAARNTRRRGPGAAAGLLRADPERQARRTSRRTLD